MGNRFILIFGILSLIFLVIIVSSHSLYQYNHSIIDQKAKAWVLAKTLVKSLDLPMLEGEMESVQKMLVTVGEIEHLKRIHITDDKGVIRYSSNPKKVNTATGSEVIKQALESHEEVDDFEQREEDNIFSLALPIPNEKRCHNCHGGKKQILGILRVGIDWGPIKADLGKVLQRDIIVSLLFYGVILVLSFLLQGLYNNAQKAYVHLQQTQTQLIKTEKMAAIGQMAAAISHDLRNPLTGIKMATYYLGSKIDRSESELTNILKDIELEIDYASNVVTNILTYSRPIELIYAPTDINKVIEDTMHFVDLQNREETIELLREYDPHIPDVMVDNKQIKQVIINLLLNSVQAMQNGGKLTVRTRLIKDTVEIVVEDTGVGIEKKVIDRIFVPFFTTKARGVGLGLSIVNNIVLKHHGMTSVESEKDKGTIFKVILPIRKDLIAKFEEEQEDEDT